MPLDIKNKQTIENWPFDPATRGEPRKWVQGYARSVVWDRFRRWKKRLQLPDNLKTIEAGCGYGKFSMLLGLSGAQVALLDYRTEVLAVALNAHRSIGLAPRTIQGDILNLPAELEGAFDLVCSFGTLEHFSGSYRQLAFQANARLVRPGGLIFLSVPNRQGIFYRIAFGLRRKLGLVPKSFYEEPFSRKELARLAAAADIVILEIECDGTLGCDFRYWIGENAKSLCRKMFRVKKDDAASRALDLDISKIDLTEEIPDSRNYLDRRFSAAWMLIGQKAAAGREL